MASGFTYMYAGLVAIFALLFLNLAVARICETRRKSGLQGASQLRPEATTRSAQNVEYALSSPLKPFTHRQVRIHEAVSITNPDGTTEYAARMLHHEDSLQRIDSAFLQPWPTERHAQAI
ncbi:hypothetical protein WJX82_001149 [Trebouxia sp. C0006]